MAMNAPPSGANAQTGPMPPDGAQRLTEVLHTSVSVTLAPRHPRVVSIGRISGAGASQAPGAGKQSLPEAPDDDDEVVEVVDELVEHAASAAAKPNVASRSPMAAEYPAQGLADEVASRVRRQLQVRDLRRRWPASMSRCLSRSDAAEPGVRHSLRTGLSIDVDAKAGVFCQARRKRRTRVVVELPPSDRTT
jgi:hypothetical protein